MIDVYYTSRPVDSAEFVTRVLREKYGISSPQFARGEHGKPYLTNAPLFFNLSHAQGRTFVAISRSEVGLDAELLSRPLPQSVLRRLSDKERREDFFFVWTAKEAYVKYLGTSLAALLASLRFEEGVLSLDGVPVPAVLNQMQCDGYALTLCSATRQEVRLSLFQT